MTGKKLYLLWYLFVKSCKVLETHSVEIGDFYFSGDKSNKTLPPFIQALSILKTT